KTSFLIVSFRLPDMAEDDVAGQLKKCVRRLADFLEEEGFKVFDYSIIYHLKKRGKTPVFKEVGELAEEDGCCTGGCCTDDEKSLETIPQEEEHEVDAAFVVEIASSRLADMTLHVGPAFFKGNHEEFLSKYLSDASSHTESVPAVSRIPCALENKKSIGVIRPARYTFAVDAASAAFKKMEMGAKLNSNIAQILSIPESIHSDSPKKEKDKEREYDKETLDNIIYAALKNHLEKSVPPGWRWYFKHHS
ncbi:MAG: hypothetical protein QW728_02470, partial [Thermoplasmata archaeon]